MLLNYTQLVEHNKKFVDSFIDLKVDGWKAFADAFNVYTHNFYREQVESMTGAVEKTANIMKGKFDE